MPLLDFLRRRLLSAVRTAGPMLMNAEHWELTGVDFYRFFEALPALAPADALLVLAEGSPSSELLAFYGLHARQPGEAVVKALRPEFRDAVFLPITPPLMSAFAALAGRHAEPEVAIHLAVTDAQGVVLEWFDAPDDPVSVAARVAKDAVGRLAEKTGATCRKRRSIGD